MTLDELRARHPKHTLHSEPDAQCRKCKGTGEFPNQRGTTTPCLCVALSSDVSPETRALVVESFGNAVKSIAEELKTPAGRKKFAEGFAAHLRKACASRARA